jgi:CheY-like chemotaxis protein
MRSTSRAPLEDGTSRIVGEYFSPSISAGPGRPDLFRLPDSTTELRLFLDRHAMPGELDGIRVLVVDDDKDVLESFNAALQAEGAETLTVEDGNAAVAACMSEDPPDVVVLDMMLPKRSGFLVLEKIKGRDDSPIVIMVTANEGRRHQAYAESLGVDKYLLKPVPLTHLVRVICDLLDQEDADEGEADDKDADRGGKN